MIETIINIHLKVQKSVNSEGSELSFNSLADVYHSILENAPDAYKEDRLFMALVDDFLTHTLSSCEKTTYHVDQIIYKQLLNKYYIIIFT